jgi:hypothetical protein
MDLRQRNHGSIPEKDKEITYFFAETNNCTIMTFSCTVLFITSTCFGHSCDHLQGVVQSEYKQYFSDYIKSVKKNLQRFFIADSTDHPIVECHKIKLIKIK